MVQRCGPRLTAAQKAELWRRWRAGESLNAIGPRTGSDSEDGAVHRGWSRWHPSGTSAACAPGPDPLRT